MQDRLNHHNNPVYRHNHPSLHYFVWDQGSADVKFLIEEKFVFLASLDKDIPILERLNEEARGLFLNLLEMWCCLVLQTLTKNFLIRYLPSTVKLSHPGTNLNVAIPLHQAPAQEKDFCDSSMYHSNDPEVQRYHASLRRRFDELRFSDSPTLRDYHAETIRRRVEARVKTNDEKLRHCCTPLGIQKLVHISQDKHQTINLCQYSINISRKLVHLKDKTAIQVFVELKPENEINEHAYCETASAEDLASRLGIYLQGSNEDGAPFEFWIHTQSQEMIFKTNTLVDILSGQTMRNVRGRPRRWVALKWKNRSGQQKRPIIYTDDFGNPMRYLGEYKEGVKVESAYVRASGQGLVFLDEDQDHGKNLVEFD